MRHATHIPVLPHVSSLSLTQAEAADNKTAAATPALRSISITAIWRDTLVTPSRHSAAILLFAFVGFALPTIIGSWLDTSMKLSEYARTRAVVALYDKPSLTILLVQAGLGLLALTFARGAIAWLALCGNGRCEDDEARGSFGAACRAPLVRFPTLLVGSLLYGAVITVGSVALSALTRGLEFTPNKMAHIWAGTQRAFSDSERQLVWQGLNALLLDPGSPFAAFIPDARQAMSRHLTPLMAFGGLFTLIIAETLLRFRTITTLAPKRLERSVTCSLLAPLVDSVHLGWRHFGAITLHIWLLRLAIFALTIALVEFSVAMMDHFIVPNVIHLGLRFEILLIMKFAAAASTALVTAILLAWCVMYDARLYAALTHQANDAFY